MTYIITGASGIVGRAVLKGFKQAGHRVVGVDLAPDRPECLSEGEYCGAVDLASPDAVQGLADRLAAQGEVIRGLVNVAGGFTWETIADGSLDSWTRMFTMNIATALNTCRACVPLIEDGGSIVNVGATAAAKADLGMGAYAASKSGVLRLTESLSAELKPRGIRVNAVSPLIVDTPTNRADMPDADFDAWVRPYEVADAVLLLISQQASAITGQNLCLTGRM